jgi:hypothetical protein
MNNVLNVMISWCEVLRIIQGVCAHLHSQVAPSHVPLLLVLPLVAAAATAISVTPAVAAAAVAAAVPATAIAAGGGGAAISAAAAAVRACPHSSLLVPARSCSFPLSCAGHVRVRLCFWWVSVLVLPLFVHVSCPPTPFRARAALIPACKPAPPLLYYLSTHSKYTNINNLTYLFCLCTCTAH